jgi:DNA-binding beta-propeller fold protein YncE
VNFNLHGDPVPSSVSVVYTPSMTEVARPTTCVMPHGSRINVAGTRQYSACMHDDQMVEVDTRTFQVTARFLLKPGAEAPLPLNAPASHVQHAGAGPVTAHAGMDMSASPAPAAPVVCSPTWAQPGAGAWSASVYVLCNKNAEVLEVDTRSWKVTRRFATAKGPYNAAVSPDGRLLVISNKASQSVGIIDLQTGTEVARIATTRPITHGVVISPDGLYAFVTNEAVGSTRGTVDVIDLKGLTRVASVDVQYQPGGIDLLPMP